MDPKFLASCTCLETSNAGISLQSIAMTPERRTESWKSALSHEAGFHDLAMDCASDSNVLLQSCLAKPQQMLSTTP